jgi:hypothetical protein
VVVLLTVFALAAAACSRSGSDTSASGSSTSTTAATTSSSTFGTMSQPVCGPKPAGETNTATGARGVTADQIEVGTISDPGYSGTPGLNQELFDASTVFTKWCNSLGGINGRQLKDDQLDAAVLNYNAQIVTACNQDFALVGGGGVSDDTGQATRLGCMLPAYEAYLVTPKARGADLSVQVTPGPNNSLNFGVMRYLLAKYPDSVGKVGYMSGSYATLTTNKDQYQEAAESMGAGKPAYDGQYNIIGESSWTPLAQAIKSAGVKGLFFVGEPDFMGQLVSALASINYKLDWITAAANEYDTKLTASAKTALDYEPVYIQLGTTPFEDKSNKAIAQYEALFNQYLPDSSRKTAALGLNSFSAWLLWAQSVKSCGGDVTAKCVYDAANKVTNWDGGGLQAPSNPSKGTQASACMAIVKPSSTSWSIVSFPPETDGWNCSPKNVVALKGNYGEGEKLSDVGKSMSDLK